MQVGAGTPGHANARQSTELARPGLGILLTPDRTAARFGVEGAIIRGVVMAGLKG